MRNQPNRPGAPNRRRTDRIIPDETPANDNFQVLAKAA